MAHLKKRQYAYRRERAARRNADNEAVAVEHGMTEAQAGLVSDLCRLRHELHTHMDAVTRSDADLRIKAQLVAANAAIKESGLTPVSCILTDEVDYIDIDKQYGTAWCPSGALRVF